MTDYKEIDSRAYDVSEKVREDYVTKAWPQELDLLVDDHDPRVRIKVAERGRDKDLDQLVYDRYDLVRRAVADQGRDKDLDKLTYDESLIVRESVAMQGRDQDLDQLVNDESHWVRSAVAMQGREKDLDKLVNDKSWMVRRSVAEVGREKDLDQLVSDDNQLVADVAKKQAEKLARQREYDANGRKILAALKDADLDGYYSNNFGSGWYVKVVDFADTGLDEETAMSYGLADENGAFKSNTGLALATADGYNSWVYPLSQEMAKSNLGWEDHASFPGQLADKLQKIAPKLPKADLGEGMEADDLDINFNTYDLGDYLDKRRNFARKQGLER